MCGCDNLSLVKETEHAQWGPNTLKIIIYRQKRLFKNVTGVSDVAHSMSNSYCYSNIVKTTLIQYSKVWYCSNQLRPDQNMLVCRPWHLPCRFYNNPDISWEKHCLWANDYLSKLHHTHWLVTNKIARPVVFFISHQLPWRIQILKKKTASRKKDSVRKSFFISWGCAHYIVSSQKDNSTPG